MNPPLAHNFSVFVKLSSKITLFLRYPRRGKKVQLHAFLDLKLVQQKQRKQLHPRRGEKVAILLVPLRCILFGVVLRICHVFWRLFNSGFEVRIIYFIPEHSPRIPLEKPRGRCCKFRSLQKHIFLGTYILGLFSKPFP